MKILAPTAPPRSPSVLPEPLSFRYILAISCKVEKPLFHSARQQVDKWLDRQECRQADM